VQDKNRDASSGAKDYPSPVWTPCMVKSGRTVRTPPEVKVSGGEGKGAEDYPSPVWTPSPVLVVLKNKKKFNF
jgi:hypothetical protein